MAESGAVIPAACGVISGRDPRHANAAFVNQIFLAVTGGAGTPWTDGWLTIIHVGCRHVRRDSVEVDELAHPILVRSQRLVPDTEGAGRFRGAPSAQVEYGPVGTTLSVAYGTDGSVRPAMGVRGGTSGGLSQHFRRTSDGSMHPLPAQGIVQLADGETVVSVTAGGGGYGDPLDRPRDDVARDVAEGWITAERAREVYGWQAAAS